jgi:hypothetical protein
MSKHFCRRDPASMLWGRLAKLPSNPVSLDAFQRGFCGEATRLCS